jgi:hypothetical protein
MMNDREGGIWESVIQWTYKNSIQTEHNEHEYNDIAFHHHCHVRDYTLILKYQ